MANTANSFAALLGAGGEAANSAGGKKKKKSKSKKTNQPEENPKVEIEERPASAPVRAPWSRSDAARSGSKTVGTEVSVQFLGVFQEQSQAASSKAA